MSPSINPTNGLEFSTAPISFARIHCLQCFIFAYHSPHLAKEKSANLAIRAKTPVSISVGVNTSVEEVFV